MASALQQLRCQGSETPHAATVGFRVQMPQIAVADPKSLMMHFGPTMGIANCVVRACDSDKALIPASALC